MVCSFKSGRMAALARLLAPGSASQTLTEQVDCQNLGAKYLYRELWEADEANLLDEEDMHMFGLNPMTDPLYLVSCNACRKPVKASHYAAHAELCKLLDYREDIIAQVEGTSGKKKLLRKDRKKLQNSHANQATLQEKEKFESLDSDVITVSDSCHDEQHQTIPLAEAKRNRKCRNGMPRVNDLNVNQGNMEDSETMMQSTTRHFKRTIAESQSCSDAKIPWISSEEVVRCPELPAKSSDGIDDASKFAVGNQIPDQISGPLGSKAISKIPAPLATKIYYSQRSNYLRRVISQMYSAKPRNEDSSEFLTSEELQVNSEQTQTLSPSHLYDRQVENQQFKETL